MSEGGGCHIQAAAPERDVELREIDLDRVSRLIHRRAGIVLSTNKRAMVYGRLARRVRALGFTCFRDYLDHLEADAGGAEEERFINALTTNLTAFFREPHHFELLARHVAGRESARVWSAAASTGEEAWSIAITLRQAMGEHADAQVLATDVDTEALSRARRGIYALSDLLRHPQRNLTPYFLKGKGAYTDSVRVRPEVAAMVQFAPLNLAAPAWPPLRGPFDAIFCRNVMIYFDKATQARILSRFVPLLKPDGLLFTGHSESFAYVSDAFRLRGRTVYVLAQK